MSKRKRTITSLQKSIAFFAAVLAVSILSVWLFFVNVFSPLQDDYLSNQEELAELEKRESLQEETRNDFQEREEEAEKIFDAIPAEEGRRVVIETLERAAENTGNTYSLTSAREVPGDDGVTVERLNFGIEIGGDFSSLVDFLREIRSLPQLIYVEEISIEASSGGRLSTSATLQVYVR